MHPQKKGPKPPNQLTQREAAPNQSNTRQRYARQSDKIAYPPKKSWFIIWWLK